MISKQQKQLIIMLTLFVITITGLLKFMTNLTIIKTIETRRGIVQIYSQNYGKKIKTDHRINS